MARYKTFIWNVTDPICPAKFEKANKHAKDWPGFVALPNGPKPANAALGTERRHGAGTTELTVGTSENSSTDRRDKMRSGHTTVSLLLR